MGTPARNAPCPCGSGKKYKKCCLSKSESDLPAKAALASVVLETDLDGLSNQAVDLIEQGKWETAQEICARLRAEFPDEIDADDRLAQLYEAQGKWAPAIAHTQAALDKARQHPEKFDLELVAELEDRLAALTEMQGA